MEVSLLLSCSIAGNCYSEVEKSPGNNTWKFFNFQVLLPGDGQFPANNTWKFNIFQSPGNINPVIDQKEKNWVNFLVIIPGDF